MEQNYSPEELEKQYSPSKWAKFCSPEDAENLYEQFIISESKKITEEIQDMKKLSYGDTAEQKIDVFGNTLLPADAPIFVYVHGGFWIYGCLKDSCFFVRPFHEAGIVCAALGYDIISDTVTLPVMVQQIQRGIHVILEYAKDRGSRGVYICGHSAGGHLIMAALSGMKDNYNLIKGVFPVSGLFDIHSILPTKNASDARLTKEIAESCSPLTAVKELKKNLSPDAFILVAVAQHDSDCFQQHSKVYSKALKEIGINCEFRTVEDEDHFSVILKLSDSKFHLTKEFISLIFHRKLK